MACRSLTVWTLFVSLTCSGLAFPKDHSNDYQIGTFVAASAVTDGTITSTLHGDGTTVAGDVYANRLGVYQIKVDNGIWFVTTLTQTQDSMVRNMGMTPMHFKAEKPNPLDGLKNGDKVLFRLHERHYLNGMQTQMAIPYADNPKKEVEFSTKFVPDVASAKPEKPTDNVKAMCESNRLSAELKAQYCGVSPSAPALTANGAPIGSTVQPVAQVGILDNQSVVDMVKGGTSDDVIISRIRASKTHFDISAPATAKLMQDAPGISMNVIQAMVLSWMNLKQ